ncbi:DUF371 domain-containing protein [Candidatus Woesearchaeota archaeon]|nr:DUF371 domain-containing protein [Candidatus Woesearchaeota archaeon]
MVFSIGFKAKGHENLLGTHRNTLEFTKDTNLTKRGDCIIGVDSDFSLEELKKLKGKIKIDISVSDIHGKLISDELTAEINEEFNDPHELVVRKTEFKDKRTFAINASKAAKDIKRELIEKLKDPQTIIKIQIEKTD